MAAVEAPCRTGATSASLCHTPSAASRSQGAAAAAGGDSHRCAEAGAGAEEGAGWIRNRPHLGLDMAGGRPPRGRGEGGVARRPFRARVKGDIR